MLDRVDNIVKRRLQGEPMDDAWSMALLQSEGAELTAWLAGAHRLREACRPATIHLCSIVNAKSGLCGEDCSFCAQSAHYHTDATAFDMLSHDDLLKAAKEAEQQNSTCFSLVTSGTRMTGDDFERIVNALNEISRTCNVVPSASLGLIDRSAAERLAAAGCVTYHHNLETARSFFPQICTTHDYEEDVATVRAAKQAGMKVCCGGLFGLGESLEQRLELGKTLAALEVDSVPINFLNAIAGTPLENQPPLAPMDCLRILALYRFLLPRARVTVCGGREKILGEYQSWIFMAGADGMMVGNYLTTEGRCLEDDYQMLTDGGLTFSGGCKQ